MNYKKYIFYTLILSLTFHSSANFKNALRVGYQAFKTSLKNDLRPHVRKIEEKTIKKSLSYELELRLAVQKKRELERKLAVEKFNISKLKLKNLIYKHTNSIVGYFSKEWFSEKIKPLRSPYFLTDGKKLKESNNLIPFKKKFF